MFADQSSNDRLKVDNDIIWQCIKGLLHEKTKKTRMRMRKMKIKAKEWVSIMVLVNCLETYK